LLHYPDVHVLCTLHEIPIVQGLLGAGMDKDRLWHSCFQAPSLSLPSMMVIGGELGFKKTATYVALVVAFSTVAGFLFGMVA
jgi:uncharacterized membrane protein YraQ (UPF0718 family)